MLQSRAVGEKGPKKRAKVVGGNGWGVGRV